MKSNKDGKYTAVETTGVIEQGAAEKGWRAVPPNAGRLVEALRHVGYDNYSALADLVDNCLDADAKLIKVVLRQEDKQPVIIIADNGYGMDEATLLEAIKLGSMTERRPEADLGWFGMGFSTATLSMCQEVTVLTREAGGRMVKACVDIEKIIKENSFIAQLLDVSADDEVLFETMTGAKESGTVLVLRKIDRLSNTNLSVMADTLRGKFGEIYRYFLQGGRVILVNDRKVEPSDPLNPCPASGATKILLDENVDIDIPTEDGKEPIQEKVRVRVAWLPKLTDEGSRREGINIRTQGFYVMRNLRQIEGGSNLGGLFSKHPMLNRFRAELHLPASMDKLAEVNFRKSGYNLPQSLRDKLERLVGPHITFIRREFLKDVADKGMDDGSHGEAEREIKKKSKLLELPTKPSGGRGGKGNHRTGGRAPGDQVAGRRDRLDAICRFENVDLGHGGQLYEVYPAEDGAICIKLNIAHPFYKRVLGPFRDDPEARNCLDYLIFSMASAEMKHSTDDERSELLTAFKTTMSGNLRTLCI